MKTEYVSQLFGTLSSPVRLQIFQALSAQESKGMIAGDLAKQLNIAPNNLSFHLKTLTLAGLIHSRQAGRFVHYYANLALMVELVAFLTTNCCKESDDPNCKFCG
ncbi:ArsR/SmtB family transcription factor [Actinobacillus pleuropneumoniae]|uniref:ArsR/SmtB family transcription factor n=1 Tax=Actinobacillus pleuropneumoniae TaxID=715 RepID=UPI001EED71A0|nr:metalloregulator ArsR/SmtB family transcription factor [Actinobacillus pleuropneumoniae]UKH32963.1 transcriptional regulator [Actinobacillus pleuropneumoniae serovar 10 str. D13039]